MRRLYRTRFRRNIFAGAILLVLSSLLVSSWFYYNYKKHQLIERYSAEILFDVPPTINKIVSSNIFPPLSEWERVYTERKTTTQVIMCDENNLQLWTSINIEKRNKRLKSMGITPPKVDNFCEDMNYPINSIQLVEKPSGAAFVVHTIKLHKTEYNPNGRLIFTKRVEDEVAPLKQLKYHVIFGLFGAFIILTGLIILIYKASFAPISRLEKELESIKHGKQERLERDYPEDLTSITQALNELMFQQKENEQRYRRALNDLAHSLKTRVAVSQALLDDIEEGKIHNINQQLLEMDDVIQGQLKRASLGVKGIVENATPIKPILNSLLLMFDKVHMDKGIRVEQFINNDQTLPMSKADVMEVFGNVLENAYRYAEKRIDVFINNTEEGIIITFNNDGPAVDESISETLFKRGVRADEQNPGTGLGLALCDEIVHSYKGAIWFETPSDPSMGASLKILLPYR